MHINPTKTCVDCGKPVWSATVLRCHHCHLIHRHAATRESREVPNPSGLCMCGCGQPVPRSNRTSLKEGVVKGEFTKFLTGHQRRKSTVDYIVDPDTECWVWQRHVNSTGYALTWAGRGKRQVAHRVFYERANGPIPEGKVLDHLCRNKRCVNPDHLEVVSNTENVRRGTGARINPEIAEEIRRIYATGKYTQAEVGAMFGIKRSAVGNIVRGQQWFHGDRGPRAKRQLSPE